MNFWFRTLIFWISFSCCSFLIFSSISCSEFIQNSKLLNCCCSRLVKMEMALCKWPFVGMVENFWCHYHQSWLLHVEFQSVWILNLITLNTARVWVFAWIISWLQYWIKVVPAQPFCKPCHRIFNPFRLFWSVNE